MNTVLVLATLLAIITGVLILVAAYDLSRCPWCNHRETLHYMGRCMSPDCDCDSPNNTDGMA